MLSFNSSNRVDGPTSLGTDSFASGSMDATTVQLRQIVFKPSVTRMLPLIVMAHQTTILLLRCDGFIRSYSADMYCGNDISMPYYGLIQLSYTELKSYIKSGGTSALSNHKQHINRAMLSIGTELNFVPHSGGGKLIPYTTINYGYDFTDDSVADMPYVGDLANCSSQVEKQTATNWMVRTDKDCDMKEDFYASISYELTEAIGTGYTHSLSASLNFDL